MNFEQYIPLAVRTAKPLPDIRSNLRHGVIGLITEGGEFASEVKRVVIYAKPQTEEMTAHMREELGDYCWYLALLASYVRPYMDFVTSDSRQGWDLYTGSMHLARVTGGISEAVESGCLMRVGELVAEAYYTVESMAYLLGTTVGQMLDDNIAKLQKRFPDAYSDAAAEARADKGGADHRNS